MLNNIRVVLENENNILSTTEVIKKAFLLFKDTYKTEVYKDFINKYVYIGNGHLLVVEQMIAIGLNAQAKIYLKEYLKIVDMEDLFVPLAVDMEEFESPVTFDEWLEDLGIDIKELK